MRHAEGDLAGAERAAALDDLLERWDHRFAAVEAEALGARELARAVVLEALRLDQLVEDRLLAFRRERRALLAALDALLDPALLVGIGDVDELVADVAAIGFAADLHDLLHRRVLEAEHVVEEDRPVHILRQEAEIERVELGMLLLAAELQRIEIGGEMAAGAIGADELGGADAVERRGLDRIGRGRLLRERRDDAVAGRRFDDGGRPGGAVGLLGRLRDGREIVLRERAHHAAAVLQAPARRRRMGRALAETGEEIAPALIHRIRIGGVAIVEVFNEGGIRSGEERGFQKLGIGGHGSRLLGRGARLELHNRACLRQL